MLEVIEVLVHVIELFELQELERNLKVACLKVLPNPEERPVADERHIIGDPVGEFSARSHSIKVFLPN